LGAHGSKEQHLAAALRLLDEQGPADAALVFKLGGLAAAAHVHRSTLYRYWQTVAELTDDILRWEAIQRPGWQRRLVDSDPAAPIDRSLADAMGSITHEFGIAVRSGIIGFLDRPAAIDVARWERAWLDALAWWIGAHLRAHGRRPRGQSTPLDLAIALASAVEGPLVMGALHGGPLLEGWRSEQTDQVVRSVSELVAGLSTEGPDEEEDRAAPRPELPRLDSWSAVKRSLMGRLTDKINSSPFGTAGAPEASRMVDFRALSRAIGVSDRRLYAIWPSPEAFNADLVELVIARHRLDGEATAADALATALQHPGADVQELMVVMGEAIIIGGAQRGRSSAFACVSAMSSPVVRARGVAVIDDSMAAQKVSTLAMLQAFGFDIRPPYDLDRLMTEIFGAIAGGQRLALVHRDLHDQVVRYRNGPAVRSLAMALAHALAAGTVRRPSPRAAGAGGAPGVPGT
jgi:AcrR family transcriptional regulator